MTTTLADLAPASGRWTPARKAEVLAVLDRGAFTQSDVEAGLGLTAEEIAGWRRRFRRAGREGLAESRIPEFRR